jgi:hypothetical protein
MNNYSIIVLGVSGSGKTVFLASLFKTFSTLGKFGFFLEAENSDKRKSLNKIYEELITGESWPPGTRNTGQWTFNCYVKNSELSPVQACTLTYVDYAGGLITDSSTEAGDSSQLESLIKSADAVLALIDGQKLLSLMEDKDLSSNVVSKFIHKDLPNIMQLVEKPTYPKNTPVHFIISKWDLLENSYSLKEVRDCLLDKVREFKNVVNSRKQARCPVRLIPISSVGEGFAILKPNGQMEKIPGKIPVPLNLEVPLAFALTDKQHNQIDDPKPSSNSQPKTFKRNIIIYIFLGFITIVLIPWGFIIAVAYFLIRMFVKKKQNTTKKDASTASSQESVSNINAFTQVLNTCKSIQQKFLAEFPESNL